MSRTVFKKIEDTYKAVYIELKREEKKTDYKDKVKIEQLKKQKDLIQEVINYVNSFVWLKHEGTIERVKFFLKSKFNLQEFCNHFGITYEAGKVCISYVNKKCLEKIGRNTLDLILEGKLDAARAEFYFRTGQLKIRNFIVDAALVDIPEPSYIGVDLKECERELRYFRVYSQAVLTAELEKLDKDKLAYIRYILEGDNPKLVEERLHLMALLQGQTTVKEYLEEVQERNRY